MGFIVLPRLCPHPDPLPKGEGNSLPLVGGAGDEGEFLSFLLAAINTANIPIPRTDMPHNMAGIKLKSHSGLPIYSPTIETPTPTAQAFQIPWMATAAKYAAKNFEGALLMKSRDNSPTDQPRSGHV